VGGLRVREASDAASARLTPAQREAMDSAWAGVDLAQVWRPLATPLSPLAARGAFTHASRTLHHTPCMMTAWSPTAGDRFAQREGRSG
jgi:hypothetical protein